MPKTFEKRFAKFRDKLQKLLVESFPELSEDSKDDSIEFFLCLKDKDKTAHIGLGCPACLVEEAVKWMIENRLAHDDGKPFMLPVGIAIIKAPEPDDINADEPTDEKIDPKKVN